MNLLNRTKQRRKKVSRWIKEHKFELSIGAGVLIFTGIGVAIGLKCKNQKIVSVTANPIVPISEVISIFNSSLDKVSNNSSGSPKSPHTRNGHIRNLVKKKASPQKIEEALKLGIELQNENQTYVKQSFVHAN